MILPIIFVELSIFEVRLGRVSLPVVRSSRLFCGFSCFSWFLDVVFHIFRDVFCGFLVVFVVFPTQANCFCAYFDLISAFGNREPSEIL
jgi:hypothetical protein